MAKEYFEKLTSLVSELDIINEVSSKIEIKHFFSGAALYVNDTICASWSPSGLAFKLPENKVNTLIKEGKAIPLKYFPQGYVKKGYALFINPNGKKPNHWKKYFIESVGHV